MLTVIITAIFIGLVVGALARLALPGRDPLSIPKTILVGIGGALLASVVVQLIADRRGVSFFAAFCGAVLIMYFIRRSRGGGLLAADAEHAARRTQRPR